MPTGTTPAAHPGRPGPITPAARPPSRATPAPQIHGPDRRRAEGPVLVLLAGVVGDHSDLALLVPRLAPCAGPQLLLRSRPGLHVDSGYAIVRNVQRLAAALDVTDGPVDAFAQGFDATLCSAPCR